MIRIRTFTGQTLDLSNLTPDQIDIVDIATALSRICRWGGHTRHFYSVAEHSINVSILLPEKLRLAGLLHDAAEAYLGDMVGPLKSQPFMSRYRVLEDQLLAIISVKYSVDFSDPLIHGADRDVLEMERSQFIDDEPGRLRWSPPEEAKKYFLSTFENLYQGATHASHT